MRGILRLGLMMLLVAAAGVGNVWGKWVTLGSGDWQYEKIANETCRIQIPESYRSSISGSVEVPRYVGDISISFRVVEIAENAFSGCSGLTAVVIPSSVETIAKEAFYFCINLATVDIPNSVTTIGEGAFKSCYNLKKVNIPKGVTEIAKDAFCGCGLKEVTIPSSVKTIGESAFYACDMKSVTIPEGVKTIGKFAFSGCKELKEVTIPSSVKTIGDGAFAHCNQLTEFKVDEENASYSEDGGVLFTKNGQTLIAYPGGRKRAYEIPGSVMRIDPSAFRGCRGLTAVEIPSSVGWIGPNAFADCVNLNTVYIYQPDFQGFLAKETALVDETAFERIAKSATLYVRKGMKEQIKDEPWCKNRFKNIVEFCVVTFDAKGGTPTLDAQKVEEGKTATAPTLTKDGYTFVEWQLDDKKYDFSTPVTKDIKLVAVWKQNFTVTFDAKGGTPAPGAQTVVEDGTATAPTLTKDGYTFVEWRLDGKKYDFSTPVTKDIKLVAKWKKNEESTPKDPKTAVESVQLAGVRVVRNPMGETLELEGMERAARVEVYSVVGAQVHAEALRGEPRVVIDAQGWAHGVYVVKVEASDGERTLRVVK